MQKTSQSLHRLAQAGLIAAMYAVLTLVIPAASFGPVQFRFSEALTILPVVTPAAIPGLAVGCLLANGAGLLMGANVAGVWDLLIGSAATLIAALCSYGLRRFRLRGLPVLATLPPVLINALIIGWELTVVLLGGWYADGFALMAAEVAAGQLLPCIGGGLLLYAALQKSGVSRKLFDEQADFGK